jgi:hypothetical protein
LGKRCDFSVKVVVRHGAIDQAEFGGLLGA